MSQPGVLAALLAPLDLPLCEHWCGMVFLKFNSAVIGTFSVELERFGSWIIYASQMKHRMV